MEGRNLGKVPGPQQAGIAGFTKPKKFLFFKIKPRPVFAARPRRPGGARCGAF